jgi:hypothetical protein
MPSRSARWLVVGFLVFVFLGTSAMLARALSAAGTERSRVADIVKAEARGDADRVVNLTPACKAEPACAATTRAFVAKLQRPGDVQILRYDPSVQVTFTRTTGTGRIAWRAGSDGLPVVQCVRVRRDGPLTGNTVELLSISAPIGNESPCP